MFRGRKDDWDRPSHQDLDEPKGLSGPRDDDPPSDDAWAADDLFSAQLKGGQGLPAAVVAGVVAAAVGVAVWGLITWQTGAIFAVVALGIGYLVGFAVRSTGGGTEPVFGVVAAGITLLASFAGLILSAAIILAEQEEIPLGEVFEQLDPAVVIEVLGQVVSPITIIILIFAVYESFRVAVIVPPSMELPSSDGEEAKEPKQDGPGL